MSRDTWLTQLRVAGNDASAVEKLVADGRPDDGLQLAGQAVLRCPPASGLIAPAAMLAASLSRRGWPGDRELTAELEHVRDGTNSELSLLPVELDREPVETVLQHIADFYYVAVVLSYVLHMALEVSTSTVW